MTEAHAQVPVTCRNCGAPLSENDLQLSRCSLCGLGSAAQSGHWWKPLVWLGGVAVVALSILCGLFFLLGGSDSFTLTTRFQVSKPLIPLPLLSVPVLLVLALIPFLAVWLLSRSKRG